MEHDEPPPLCARLLAELSRRDHPTPIAELPERLCQKAVLSGCERRGLAVGVVWYEGSPGSSGVLSGGTPYIAVGTSPGWYPSAGLTHRPAPTHFALTAKGKEWLEEEQLRTDPRIDKLSAAAEAVGEYERRYQEGMERVSRAIQSVPPFSETMKEAYLEALAEHEKRKAAESPKALPPATAGASTAKKPDGGYTVAALREMTGLENTTLNRYAKMAKVTTPRRGERNFKYTLADVRAILETIIASTAEDKLRDKCRTSLRNLPEIAE